MNEGVHAMQTLCCFGKSLIFSTGFTKKNQIIMNSLSALNISCVDCTSRCWLILRSALYFIL